MKTTLKEITPQWAKQILETRNPKNRKISLPFVERLARDIKAGGWVLNHQGIAFNENGDLLDGQHRLQAIVLANTPVRSLVTTGIPPTFRLNGTTVNTFETIDCGKVRSVSQVLSMGGWKYATKIAAVSRNVANMFVTPEGGNWLSITAPQTEKILYRLGKHIQHVVETSCARAGVCCPHSPALAVIAFYRITHQQKADEFLYQVCTLSGVSKGSAPHSLATWTNNHHGFNQPLDIVRVAASAVHRFDRGLGVDRLVGSEESVKWLRETDKATAQYIRGIMELA